MRQQYVLTRATLALLADLPERECVYSPASVRAPHALIGRVVRALRREVPLPPALALRHVAVTRAEQPVSPASLYVLCAPSGRRVRRAATQTALPATRVRAGGAGGAYRVKGNGAGWEVQLQFGHVSL